MSTLPYTIGIDARAASEVPAGRGRVVRELLRALGEREHGDARHRYVLYARSAWSEQPFDERFSWRLIDARDPWWHVLAARAANRECDVFLSLQLLPDRGVHRIPTVPIVYDMVTFEPSMRPTALDRHRALDTGHGRAPARLRCWRSPKPPPTPSALASRRPSDAQSWRRWGLRPHSRARSTPRRLRHCRHLALCLLSAHWSRARICRGWSRHTAGLTDICRSSIARGGGARWAGRRGPRSRRCSLGNRCTMLGHVSDAALAELYRRCAVFCYPSLGEGFGLPGTRGHGRGLGGAYLEHLLAA